MSEALRPIEARMDTRSEGTVTLDRDPAPGEALPLSVLPPARLHKVVHESPARWSARSGYRIEDGNVVFVFAPEHFPHHDWTSDPVRVAGNFNGWAPDDTWKLTPVTEHHRTRLALRVPATRVTDGKPDFVDFKFISVSGFWFQPPDHAPNRTLDPMGRPNLRLDPDSSGHHALRFTLEDAPEPGAPITLLWGGTDQTLALTAAPGGSLLDLWSPAKLGVTVGDEHTTFRLFAPRATEVLLETVSPDGRVRARTALAPAADGVWEASRPGNLKGWKYRYFISGTNRDDSTAFDSSDPILDPYALAAVGPAGPGVITDDRPETHPKSAYKPPATTDLVIAEAHLRDLLALDPEFAKHPRPGFRELAAFVRKPGCPLRTLGINAVELLPVQECEAADPTAKPTGFLWGYMPVNWFAPGSHYASDPERGSQVEEFRDLVKAFHEAGIAVILDVVYNHTGAPNALLRCDKHHFFTDGPDGALSNWSGCGNDFRADTPMGLRLITDSLKHWVESYDVDGFRFDLAELLGVGVMRDIRREIGPLKENLILIAEPWSFRSYVAPAMRGAGYASWNDGYREFLPRWVWADGDADGLAHFLAGSPGAFAAKPTDTLNYTESHDDRCWLDRITENPGNDGTLATPADVARTRLMFSVLFASLGVPMFAAGQEFLRTKGGANNTYLRGDLSKLTSERLAKHADTREFVRGWIALRRSELGRVLRLSRAPSQTFFQKFPAADGHGLVLLYNADLSEKGAPMIFATNPTTTTVDILCDIPESGLYRLFADNRSAGTKPIPERLDGPHKITGGLRLPALSSALWILA
jgi:pullulanase